jgi:hypothetical protein
MRSSKDVLLSVVENYEGNIRELEHAIGAFIIASLYGWKAAYVFHSKKTIRHYEKILGFRFRDTFDEFGVLAYKSSALTSIRKQGNFWRSLDGFKGFKMNDPSTVHQVADSF